MPAWLLGVLIVGACVLSALAGMLLVRRLVPQSALRELNEVAGFIIAVLGVLYAVLLAFVVIAVWEEFEEARVTAEREAHSVAVIWRASQGLPRPVGQRMSELCQEYARTVIEEEWPAMARGEQSPRAWEQLDGLWRAVYELTLRTARDETLFDQIVTQLGKLGGDRRMRLLASRTGVPRAMWLVLISGALLTVAFTYFFGVRSPTAQVLMTAALATIIGLCLFMVAAINYPFTSDVRVQPEAFQMVLEMMERSEGTPAAPR
jgi:hypothetical protein